MAKSLSQQQLKLLELQYMQTEGTSINRFTYQKQLAVPFKHKVQEFSTQLQKISPQSVLIFDNTSNNNILAYGYLLLSLIYGEEMNQKLLVHVKSVLYPSDFDLKAVKGETGLSISSEIMKKFFVELIFMLSFTDFTKVLTKKLEKYPVILYIMAIFLRCVLVSKGLSQAADFDIELKTDQILPILNDFFEVECKTIENIHFFTQNYRFIYEENGQVLMGCYKEELIQIRGSTESGKPSSIIAKQVSGSNGTQLRTRNFKFDDGNRSSINNDFDALTPFFNLGSEYQQRYKDSFRNAEEQSVMELNNYASVPNFLSHNIIQVDEYEATRDIDLFNPSSLQIIEKQEEKGNVSLLQMPNFSSDYKELNATQERFSRSSSKINDMLKKNRKSQEKAIAIRKNYEIPDVSQHGSGMTEYKLIKQMEKGQCFCKTNKKNRLALYSKLYEINVVNLPFKQQLKPLCLNINSLRSSDKLSYQDLENRNFRSPQQRICYPVTQRQKVRTEMSNESSISMQRSYESLFQTFPALTTDTPKISSPKESTLHMQKTMPSFKKPLIKFTYSHCRV